MCARKQSFRWKGPAEQTQALEWFQQIQGALIRLVHAHRNAPASKEKTECAGVPQSLLRDTGLNPRDLEWLLEQGYIEQTRGAIRSGTPSLRACRRKGAPRAEEPSFRPTDRTVVLVRNLVQELGSRLQDREHVTHRPIKPTWNPHHRELWYGTVLVKRFRKAGPNQQRILDAFEEDGWPSRIDNPLCGNSELGARERLRQALGRLNRSLKRPVIHFWSDGTGRGLCWGLSTHPRRADAPR